MLGSAVPSSIPGTGTHALLLLGIQKVWEWGWGLLPVLLDKTHVLGSRLRPPGQAARVPGFVSQPSENFPSVNFREKPSRVEFIAYDT